MSEEKPFPGQIIAGDSYEWEHDFPLNEIPAESRFVFRLDSDPVIVIGVAAPTAERPGRFVFSFASTQTVLLPPGDYTIDLITVTNGARKMQKAGSVPVCPDPEKPASKSSAEEMLAAVEEHLKGRTPHLLESQTIEGNSFSKAPLDAVLAYRDKLRREVARQKRIARMNRGESNSETLYPDL